MTRAEFLEKWRERRDRCDKMSDDYLHYMTRAENEDRHDDAEEHEDHFRYWLGKWNELREILADFERMPDEKNIISEMWAAAREIQMLAQQAEEDDDANSDYVQGLDHAAHILINKLVKIEERA